MPDFNPYTPPDPVPAPTAPIIVAPDGKGAGLAGWLVLVGLGVVLSPIVMLRLVVDTVRTGIMGGQWAVLTAPGGAAYHALWGPFLIGELVVNAGNMLVAAYMIYLFFTKKKNFPQWFIWSHVAIIACQIADVFLLQLVRPDLPLLDADTRKEIGRSAFGLIVWVPYMLISKRVRLTFVRG